MPPRRRFLTGLTGFASALCAGCLNSTETDDTTTDQPQSPPQPTANCQPVAESTVSTTADAAFRHLSVDGDRPPADHRVDVDVSVRQQFTAESPAELSVRFRNEASATRTFQFTPVAPFTPADVRHTEREDKLQLVPQQSDGVSVRDTDEDGEFNSVPPTPTDGCWSATDEIYFVDHFSAVELDPCERVSQTYSVVGHPSNDGCFASGTYRTESTWYIDSAEDGKPWGFTVTIDPR